MLILLEGCDGAGKTTLARRLLRELEDRYPADSIRYLHRGIPTKHLLDEYEIPLASYRPGTGQHLVCDRWHLGQLVYPQVLDRSSGMSDEVFLHIELLLRRLGALLVYLEATPEELRRRLRVRGDDLITPDLVEPILTVYELALERTRLLPTRSTDAGTLVTRADELERSYLGLARFSTYIGPRYPDLLLLGDRRKNQPESTAAFMPYPSSSGRFLLRALLTQDSSQLARIGIANACDADDVAKLHWQLGEPRVVPLGVNAAAKLRDLPDVRVSHRAEHPQFVRRFHHRELDTYGRQLLYGEAPTWRTEKTERYRRSA